MSRLAIYPVVSEKAVASGEAGTYLFIVPKSASKVAVAREISERFKVKVTGVNMLNQSGKPKKQRVRRSGREIKGTRADRKKAIVTLSKGEKLNLFEEEK